jgi:hypothetical protein
MRGEVYSSEGQGTHLKAEKASPGKGKGKKKVRSGRESNGCQVNSEEVLISKRRVKPPRGGTG